MTNTADSHKPVL